MHVLCTGIRYGLGESRLYELFKSAWLQNPRALSYSGKGDNMIPTIHIIDLGRLIRKIVGTSDLVLKQKQYIFAIDRTPKPTQKRLIETISKGMGTQQVDDRAPGAYSHIPTEQKEFL